MSEGKAGEIKGGENSKPIHQGMLAICVKSRTHLNGLTIDHEKRTIERFEPYGDVRHSKTSTKRNQLINSQLEQIVSKLYSSFPESQPFYTCKNFFAPGHPGPQSRDPPRTGYCGAWSILYLELAKGGKIVDMDKVDFAFIKKYAEELYATFPVSAFNTFSAKILKNPGLLVARHLKLKSRKFKARAQCIKK